MAAAKQREEEELKQKSQALEEFPHSTRNTIIAVVVASVAMVTYALVIGLVRIQITRGDEEDDDEDLSTATDDNDNGS